MMHGWAERLYDYSVERNKLQRATKRVNRYGITGAGSPAEVLQGAIEKLERLSRQADRARVRHERRRGNEQPVATRRGSLLRGPRSARALALRLLNPDRLDKRKKVRDGNRFEKHEGGTRLLGFLDEIG